MSSIDLKNISAVASTSGFTGEEQSSKSAKGMSDAITSFSDMLKEMQTGSAAMSGGGSGNSDDSDGETTTVTRVMADGALLITVYQGDQIISETKTAATPGSQDPSSDGQPVVSGGTQVATSGAAALLSLLG